MGLADEGLGMGFGFGFAVSCQQPGCRALGQGAGQGGVAGEQAGVEAFCQYGGECVPPYFGGA